MTAWLPEALAGPRVVVRAGAPGDLPVRATLAFGPGVRAFAAGRRALARHLSAFEQYGLPQRQYEFRL